MFMQWVIPSATVQVPTTRPSAPGTRAPAVPPAEAPRRSEDAPIGTTFAPDSEEKNPFMVFNSVEASYLFWGLLAALAVGLFLWLGWRIARAHKADYDRLVAQYTAEYANHRFTGMHPTELAMLCGGRINALLANLVYLNSTGLISPIPNPDGTMAFRGQRPNTTQGPPLSPLHHDIMFRIETGSEVKATELANLKTENEAAAKKLRELGFQSKSRGRDPEIDRRGFGWVRFGFFLAKLFAFLVVTGMSMDIIDRIVNSSGDQFWFGLIPGIIFWIFISKLWRSLTKPVRDLRRSWTTVRGRGARAAAKLQAKQQHPNFSTLPANSRAVYLSAVLGQPYVHQYFPAVLLASVPWLATLHGVSTFDGAGASGGYYVGSDGRVPGDEDDGDEASCSSDSCGSDGCGGGSCGSDGSGCGGGGCGGGCGGD